MIRDGHIVYGAYGATESPLFWWEFESTTLNALVIAVLTTILSYQVAASLLDLFLGFKAKGIARVSDLHILLLTQQSSPLAVATNLLRNNWMTGRYFLGDIPRASNIIREERKVKFKVYAKFLILLAVAPVANITAVVLSLENEKTLTFGDLNFGGLALGVNTDLSVVNSEVYSPACRRMRLQTTMGEDTRSIFSICSSSLESIESEPAVNVLITTGFQTDLASAVLVGKECSSQIHVGNLYSNNKVYDIKLALTYGSFSRLADVAVGLLFDELGIETANVNEAVLGSEGFHNLSVWRSIAHTAPNNSGIANKVNLKLSKYVTFVDAPSLEITGGIFDLEKQRNFTTADDIPLLTRRRRNMSLPLLTIVSLFAVVIRVVVKIVCNNDLSEGLEQVIKEQVGIERDESIFQGGERKVCYNKKYQHGICAQYGLVRDDMPEVDGFVGGFIGLKQD